MDSFDQQVKDYCKSCTNKSSNRLAKVIVIGDAGVGKTSLIKRFVNNSFGRDYKATIGVDFEVEKFKVLNCLFNLQLWDTAGHERFKCIASAYYRGANAILVTFDLSQKESLKNCESWLKDALTACTDEKRPLVILVGTKLDLLKVDDSSSAEETAKVICKRLDAEYWQVSSCTGENVNDLFYRVTALLFNQVILNEFLSSKSQTKKLIQSDITLRPHKNDKTNSETHEKCC